MVGVKALLTLSVKHEIRKIAEFSAIREKSEKIKFRKTQRNVMEFYAVSGKDGILMVSWKYHGILCRGIHKFCPVVVKIQPFTV